MPRMITGMTDKPAKEGKLKGLNKFTNVTLKWGITDPTELADWYEPAGNGANLLNTARRSMTILARTGPATVKGASELAKAWPGK